MKLVVRRWQKGIWYSGTAATEAFTYYVLRADSDAVIQLKKGQMEPSGLVMDFGAVKVHLSEAEWKKRAKKEGHTLVLTRTVQCLDCGHIRLPEEGHDCPDGSGGTYDANGWT